MKNSGYVNLLKREIRKQAKIRFPTSAQTAAREKYFEDKLREVVMELRGLKVVPEAAKSAV